MYATNSQLGQQAGIAREMSLPDEGPRSSRLLLCALQDMEQLIKVAEASADTLYSTKARIFGHEPPTASAGSSANGANKPDGIAPEIGDAILTLRQRLGVINTLANELADRL